VLFTQKVLMAAPGLAAAGLWYLRTAGGAARSRGINLTLAACGFLVPLAATTAFFAFEGAVGAFVESVFLLNLGWKYRLSPWGLVEELYVEDTLLVVLGGAGVLLALGRWAARRAEKDYLLLLSTLSLGAGIFLIPTPHRQYALLFLPLLALYAGGVLASAVEWLCRRLGVASSAVLSAAVLATSLGPADHFRRQFDRSNWGTLRSREYVTRRGGSGRFLRARRLSTARSRPFLSAR
jgi:hypothetical protein